MKTINKFLATVLIICTVICACPITYASADAAETASAVIVAAEGLEAAYDTSVVSRMAGRAGAASPYGAKGISFEIMLQDKLNLESIFKPGTKVKLSESSIDSEADLVSTKNGLVDKNIQCKDGVSKSQISDVIKRVEGGQYADSELVGTSEFADAYNPKAVKKGLAPATDSGISTKSTSSVAEKALGNINPETLKANVFNAAKFGTAISTVFSVAESIANQDSFNDAVGNVVTNDAVATVTAAICPLSDAAMISALSYCGITGTAASATGTVVGIVATVATGYVLYLLVDEIHMSEAISGAVDWMGDKLTNVYDNIRDKVECAVTNVSATCNPAAEFVSEKSSAVGSWIKGACSKAVCGFNSVVSFFGNLI